MTIFIKTVAAVAAGAVLAMSAFAQSARTPLVAIENEPAPKLVVDPPLMGPLAHGAVLIPYRGGELAHLTGARGERPQRISAGRPSACYRRRSALALGGL
jgi:hypothetical protein